MTDNWKDKYPIGSQWKARGGWRAVVVRIPERGGYIRACHEQHDLVVSHRISDGGIVDDYQHVRANKDYDLIEPWKEPRTGEFWVNVYEPWTASEVARYSTREIADENAIANRIACVPVKWTEGEGLED